MIDFSDVAIMDHYKSLPSELKTRLFNDDTSEIIFTICSQSKLSLDQMNMCAEEVDLFLLGMTLPENFPKKLSARTEMSPEVTNHIVESLSAKLFNPLKEPLKALYKATDIVFPKVIPPQVKGAPEKPVASQATTVPPAPAAPAAPTQPPKIALRSIPIVIEKTTPQAAVSTVPTQTTPPLAPPPTPQISAAPITVAPLSPMPPEKPTTSTPTPFIGRIPTAAIQSAATPSVPTRRPLNWSDILANQSKESNEVGVIHSKLEKALNSTPSTTQSYTKPAPASYAEKDPYREPIDIGS